MATIKIIFCGIDLDISFDHQPEEKMVMYYSDGSGYPGCAEQIDNITIVHKGEDITELCEPHMERIEEQIYEYIHRRFDDY